MAIEVDCDIDCLDDADKGHRWMRLISTSRKPFSNLLLSVVILLFLHYTKGQPV